jgi:mRNA-degrading endonuclease YafQ of YafQ-DinJ toxin-antitoxin module|tara:strand:- start:84 stop:269 length:186 start_codon:yes stop_codon:yes gene_type:complete
MKDMDLDGIVKKVDELKDEVKDIKEINKVLMDKLQKAYNDRVELRAKNHNLTGKLKGVADA